MLHIASCGLRACTVALVHAAFYTCRTVTLPFCLPLVGYAFTHTFCHAFATRITGCGSAVPHHYAVYRARSTRSRCTTRLDCYSYRLPYGLRGLPYTHLLPRLPAVVALCGSVVTRFGYYYGYGWLPTVTLPPPPLRFCTHGSPARFTRCRMPTRLPVAVLPDYRTCYHVYTPRWITVLTYRGLPVTRATHCLRLPVTVYTGCTRTFWLRTPPPRLPYARFFLSLHSLRLRILRVFVHVLYISVTFLLPTARDLRFGYARTFCRTRLPFRLRLIPVTAVRFCSTLVTHTFTSRTFICTHTHTACLYRLHIAAPAYTALPSAFWVLTLGLITVYSPFTRYVPAAVPAYTVLPVRSSCLPPPSLHRYGSGCLRFAAVTFTTCRFGSATATCTVYTHHTTCLRLQFGSTGGWLRLRYRGCPACRATTAILPPHTPFTLHAVRFTALPVTARVILVTVTLHADSVDYHPLRSCGWIAVLQLQLPAATLRIAYAHYRSAVLRYYMLLLLRWIYYYAFTFVVTRYTTHLPLPRVYHHHVCWLYTFVTLDSTFGLRLRLPRYAFYRLLRCYVRYVAVTVHVYGCYADYVWLRLRYHAFARSRLVAVGSCPALPVPRLLYYVTGHHTRLCLATPTRLPAVYCYGYGSHTYVYYTNCFGYIAVTPQLHTATHGLRLPPHVTVTFTLVVYHTYWFILSLRLPARTVAVAYAPFCGLVRISRLRSFYGC